MNILIIKFRHIGDVLLSTALIHNLRIHYPDAKIDVAVNDDCAAMLENNPDINRLFLYPRKKRNQSPTGRITQEIRYLKKILNTRYDLTINLTEGDRGAIYSFLTRAKTRLGIRTRNPLIRGMKPYTKWIEQPPVAHTVERDLFFLTLIDLPIREKKVKLFHSQEDDEFVTELLKSNSIQSFVVVHPVSRWMFKCWDDRRFANVIDYIFNHYGKRVVITASPDRKEMEKISNILNHCKTNPLNLSGQLSLGKLSALISKAKLFLGVDTAPMHMAGAYNIPVIALFGASDPAIWGPWENELQKTCYTTEPIIQSCGKHTIIFKGEGDIIWRNGHKISTSMMDIKEKEVIDAIDHTFNTLI